MRESLISQCYKESLTNLWDSIPSKQPRWPKMCTSVPTSPNTSLMSQQSFLSLLKRAKPNKQPSKASAFFFKKWGLACFLDIHSLWLWDLSIQYSTNTSFSLEAYKDVNCILEKSSSVSYNSALLLEGDPISFMDFSPDSYTPILFNPL